MLRTTFGLLLVDLLLALSAKCFAPCRGRGSNATAAPEALAALHNHSAARHAINATGKCNKLQDVKLSIKFFAIFCKRTAARLRPVKSTQLTLSDPIETFENGQNLKSGCSKKGSNVIMDFRTPIFDFWLLAQSAAHHV